MKKNLNIKLFFVLLIITYIFCTCNSSSKLQNKENVLIVKQPGKFEYDSEKMNMRSRGSFKEMTLHFLNNPYGFSDNYYCSFFVDNKIIFWGKFNNSNKIEFPDSLLNQPYDISLDIYKSDDVYTFFHFQYEAIPSNTQQIQITFNPKAREISQAARLTFK